MRYLWTIVWTVLSLFLGAAGKGQSVFDQKIRGQGAYSHDFVNVFSGLHNQAALSRMEAFSAGVFIGQRFSLKALRSVSLAMALPVNNGTFSLLAHMEGFSAFKKQEWRAGYAHPLLDWMEVGADLDYFRMQVPGKGNADAMTFSLSVMFHIRKEWQIGLQLFNPEKAHYRKLGKDELPNILQLGVGFQPSDNFFLIAEGRFSEREKSLLLAFRYRLEKILSLDAGVSTGAYPVYAGVELYLKKIEILFTASYHRQLGLSPAMGVIYSNPLEDE